MLKGLPVFLAIMLLLTSFNINTISANPNDESLIANLSDVQINDWYVKNLVFLYNKKVVQGTDEGKFLPNKEVTAAEYIKMVVAAKYGEQELGGISSILSLITKPQWYKPYVDKAIKEGIISKNDFTEAQYKSPINRYNMAKIIIKACNESYGEYNSYASKIKDYKDIPKEYQEYVLKAYSKGIITGYGDKTFGGSNNMKRSESIAVIARLIDESHRVIPEKPMDEDEEESAEGEITPLTEKEITGFMKGMDPRISRTVVTYPVMSGDVVAHPNVIAANKYAREYLKTGSSVKYTNSKDVDELMEKLAAFAVEWMYVDSNLDYRKIDDYRAKAEQMLDDFFICNYLEGDIKRYVKNKVVVEGEFYTHKNLVVVSPAMGIRGTWRCRYLEPTNPKYLGSEIKINTWYEADYQLDINVNKKGEMKANGYEMIPGTLREVGGK